MVATVARNALIEDLWAYDRLLAVHDVAAMLHVEPEAVWSWHVNMDLPGLSLNRDAGLYIRESSLLAWLAARNFWDKTAN